MYLLEGMYSEVFFNQSGGCQGCTLSPTLFLIYINGLLNENEKCPELGVKFSKNKMSGLLFSDDFVGLAETGPALQSLIDIVLYGWRLKRQTNGNAITVDG